MDAPPVIALFGPTAIGKTDTAVELAAMLRQRLGCGVRLISADAFAVYREIPIITGAPNSEEWLTVGTRSVTQSWSAGEFAVTARAAIDAAVAAGDVPIVAGGTGLYLQAALSNIEMRAAVPKSLRETIGQRLKRDGARSMHAELERAAPQLAATIAPTDAHRIARALEAIELGDEPSVGSGLWTARLRHPTLLAALTGDRDLLRSRIGSRIDSMIELGAVEEVEAAWQLGPSSTAAKAIGMDELMRRDIERMKIRTWQLARRQFIWARKLDSAEAVQTQDRSPASVARSIYRLLASRMHA